MDEKRLRELESWVLSERDELSDSENVLLDAIAEVCVELRRAWKDQESGRAELEAWQNKAHSYRAELLKDKSAMEGADVELAVGDNGAADKARAILSDRLESYSEAD